MSLTYREKSRLPRERGGRGGASVAMAPVIDRSSTDTSLLLRCDRPATISVSVSGIPFPEVTWFVGSRVILQEGSPEYRVDVDFGIGRGGGRGGGRLILSISRVTEELERGIRVEAVNCTGSDKIRIKVRTYKVFCGRSQFEWNKSSSLPPNQRYRFHHAAEPEVKIKLYKSYKNQFQTAHTDYETWEEEMKTRKRMRSIDDIFDYLSDQGSSETNETKNRPKSFTLDRSNSTNFRRSSSPPPPPDKTNRRRHRRRRRRHHHRGPSVSLSDKDPLWEMFGTKLSDLCRRILSSDIDNSARFPDTYRRILPSPFASRNQSRSLPLERRRYLGPGTTGSRDGAAIAGQDLERNFSRRSFGGVTHPPRRPREMGTTLLEGNSPPVSHAPLLVTAPQFLEADSEDTVLKERASPPKNSAQENVLEDSTALTDGRISHKVSTRFPMRPYHLELVRNQGFFREKGEQSNSKVDRHLSAGIQDCYKKLVEGRPTYKNHGTPEQTTTRKYNTRQNTDFQNCQKVETILIDNTRTISINVRESRSYATSAKKEPERDEPLARSPAEDISLAGSGEHGPVCPDKSPTSSVGRRIQSSGSFDEFLTENPNSLGPVTASASVRQLSWRQRQPQTHSGFHRLGQAPQSAAKSEGHLTERCAILPPPCQGPFEPHSGAVSVYRSVNGLEVRDPDATQRIGSQWKVVTVTMMEETLVIRRPASEVELGLPPPPANSSSIGVENNSIVWKLPLRSGRPIAV